MLLSLLLLIPIIGVFAILVNKDNGISITNIKLIALTASILNLFVSLIIFILFDFSTNQFQFVQEYHQISYFDFYLGIDGLSIYFVLLTTIIIPISLLSNWTSISKDIEAYVIIILLLETLLLAVFLVLDILLFYIFFESILPPLFILIGIFGSDNRVKASFYLFLYTLFGSLFLLLSILAMSSIMSTTDFDSLFKGNFFYLTQLFLFYGIFIAFAVKTPTIFLNTWLLKAHVESPLGGSIILAAIVLKLSLYGILRLILPILPKAYMEYTYIIYLIGVITIIYASLSTLRTIDIKELIAYSSVSHAAVYLLGVFSNSIQGIEGSINLGLAHGLVSPGLFICAGGVLYDRSHTRLISFYRGMAQIMPLFAIVFFILCLGNCGAPLTLNFIGEFMSLYGVFERSSLFGVFASSSIVFSAAYTIYMYQRIAFGGSYSRMFTVNISDLNKREFIVLLTLVVPTVLFGIYAAPILDGINYGASTLIYCFDSSFISCDAPKTWIEENKDLYYKAVTYFAVHIWLLIYLAITFNFLYVRLVLAYMWAKITKLLKALFLGIIVIISNPILIVKFVWAANLTLLGINAIINLTLCLLGLSNVVFFAVSHVSMEDLSNLYIEEFSDYNYGLGTTYNDLKSMAYDLMSIDYDLKGIVHDLIGMRNDLTDIIHDLIGMRHNLMGMGYEAHGAPSYVEATAYLSTSGDNSGSLGGGDHGTGQGSQSSMPTSTEQGGQSSMPTSTEQGGQSSMPTSTEPVNESESSDSEAETVYASESDTENPYFRELTRDVNNHTKAIKDVLTAEEIQKTCDNDPKKVNEHCQLALDKADDDKKQLSDRLEDARKINADKELAKTWKVFVEDNHAKTTRYITEGFDIAMEAIEDMELESDNGDSGRGDSTNPAENVENPGPAQPETEQKQPETEQKQPEPEQEQTGSVRKRKELSDDEEYGPSKRPRN